MRDPKQDPAAGDMLRKGRVTRTVEAVHINYLICHDRYRRGPGKVLTPLLGQYRRWAAGAEVVHVAE